MARREHRRTRRAPAVDLSRAATRALGFATASLKLGPSRERPRSHALLLRLGVLDRLPTSWADDPLLDRLPWHAGRVDAPPASPPDGVDAPWPQPPVVGPGFYDPVLHLDLEERADHFEHNVLRYLGQIVGLTPGAARRALRGPRLAPVDDARFAELLTGTSFGQFVTPLEPADREAFGPLAEEGCAKVDLSFAPREHTLPDMHVAPTVTLVRRDGDRWSVSAMRVGARLLRPDDGAAWELARYFALQGAQTRLVTSTHPRLHFPTDAVRAITRALLPAGHVVARLLAPHLVFTAGLNEAVIHHRRSVLHNSQRELYTPFPYTTRGIHALVEAGRIGVPGSEAWAPYRWSDGRFGEHVPYGRYRADWYSAVFAFVDEVLAAVPPEPVPLVAWADAIAARVPGFPDGAEIGRSDALAHAVAAMICAVSVYHTADHHSYAEIPLAELPWRLRVPAPDLADPPPGDRASWVRPEDHFRHILGHALFFAPTIRRSLADARHGFRAPRARAAELAFAARRSELDAAWAGSPFPTSAQIACSIQY